jgi:hypothetical protein
MTSYIQFGLCKKMNGKMQQPIIITFEILNTIKNNLNFIYDVTLNSLKDSNTSSKMKIMEEGIKVRSLACSTLG